MDHMCHVCGDKFSTSEELHAHVINYKLALTKAVERCFAASTHIPPEFLDVLLCLKHSVKYHYCPHDKCDFQHTEFKGLQKHWRIHTPCRVRCGFCLKVADRVSQALTHHESCSQRLKPKIGADEATIRVKLIKYSSRDLTKTLPPLARPAPRRRVAKRKRSSPNGKGTRGVGFEAGSDTDAAQIGSEDDLDFAIAEITIPDLPASESPVSQRCTDSQSLRDRGRSNRLVDEDAPTVDPPSSALTPTPTGSVDTLPPSASHPPDLWAPGLENRPYDGVGVYIPPPVGFQAPDTRRLPPTASHEMDYDGVMMSLPPPVGFQASDTRHLPPTASHEMNFQAPGLETRPYDGAGMYITPPEGVRMFPLVSASHSFDLGSYAVVE